MNKERFNMSRVHLPSGTLEMLGSFVSRYVLYPPNGQALGINRRVLHEDAASPRGIPVRVVSARRHFKNVLAELGYGQTCQIHDQSVTEFLCKNDRWVHTHIWLIVGLKN